MLRDIGLLGALHCDADMVDTAGVHKGLITLWKFLVHQSTAAIRDCHYLDKGKLTQWFSVQDLSRSRGPRSLGSHCDKCQAPQCQSFVGGLESLVLPA